MKSSAKYKQVDLGAPINGCVHFRWSEALYVPKWDVYVHPTQEQFQNIVKIAQVMDAIRNRVGKPVTITSWLRPDKYNQWPSPYGIAGAKMSQHCLGSAVDFQVATMSADEVRELLKPELERLKIRMENLPGSNWVHIDNREPGGSGRFFKP